MRQLKDLGLIIAYELHGFRYYFNLTGTESFCAQLFSRLESDQNSVLRYGKRFYEDFYQHGDILLQFLWEKAGWKL